MKYFWATVEHKFWLVVAWLSFRRIPLWRAIVHDLSKFRGAELPHYNRQFFGDKSDPEGFAVAWLHHQNVNPHHWEYWITRSDHSHGASGAIDGCLPMPYTYAVEMILDWMAASKAYTGSWDMTKWLTKNLPKIRLHPRTREQIVKELEKIGYRVP